MAQDMDPGETIGPSLDDLSSSVKAVAASVDEGLEFRRAEAEHIKAQTEGLRAYHELRKNWSPYIMGILSVAILFQIVLVSLVGSGLWKFEDNKVFVNTVAAELFLQIAGLGLVAVKCLFPASATNETGGTKPKREAK